MLKSVSVATSYSGFDLRRKDVVQLFPFSHVIAALHRTIQLVCGNEFYQIPAVIVQ